jgi:hypothetical protein
MPKDLHDNVSRVKAPSPVGRAIFVGLRAADVFWQYTLLRRGWASGFLQSIGLRAIGIDRVLDTSSAISPLQPYYKLVVLMSLGSSVKQIINMLFVFEQEVPVLAAVLISAFNTVVNSINTTMALWSLASANPISSSSPGSWSDTLRSPTVAIGLGIYTIGIITELGSELQRRAFKKDPANKGKPYAGGLFSLARNINYGGYILWRTGYAMMTGDLLWALVTFSFFFRDFTTRAVPVMDAYLTGRVSCPLRSVARPQPGGIHANDHLSPALVWRSIQGYQVACPLCPDSGNILSSKSYPA